MNTAPAWHLDDATGAWPEGWDDLPVGGIVKLSFQSPLGGESMWVVVTDSDYPQYAGTLSNHPIQTPGLEYGDVVRFEARHIIDKWQS